MKQKEMEYAVGHPRTEQPVSSKPCMGIQLKGPAEIQPALPLPVTPRQLCTGRGGGSLLLIPYGTVGTDGLSWGSYAASSVGEQRGVIIPSLEGNLGLRRDCHAQEVHEALLFLK